jgi:Pentapeptide repeats (8 copies)
MLRCCPVLGRLNEVKMNRYLAMSLFVGLLLVSGAVVLLGTLSNAPTQGAANNNFGRVPDIPRPLTLNTVAYAERVVGANLSLPNATVLGTGFRVIGVELDRTPMNQSIGNGDTFTFWSVNLYITNQPFVNGSTLNTDLYPQAIIVNETPAGPNSSSYKQAQNFATPGQACVVSHYNTSSASTSCTQGQGPTSEVIKIRNTYLAVHPTVPNAIFQIDGNDLVTAIYPGTPNTASTTTSSIMSYQQLLGLAWTMITPGSCQTQVPNKGGANLQGANLEYCNLSGYDLSGDNLQNADLQYADLHNANLHGANLKGANLANTFAMGANFQGAGLQNANLAGATLTGLSASQMTNFNGANLQRATLTSAICGSPNYITASGANTQDAVDVPAACSPPL